MAKKLNYTKTKKLEQVDKQGTISKYSQTRFKTYKNRRLDSTEAYFKSIGLSVKGS